MSVQKTASNLSKSPPNDNNSSKPFYLFYFLKSNDLVITMIIDIICKLRLRYTNKGKEHVVSFWEVISSLNDNI